jgi:hypothetical protein
MRQHDDIIVIRRDGCFILSDGYHNSDVVSELAAGRGGWLGHEGDVSL